MIIYFVSALLISAVVYKLGTDAMIISLMVTATKVAVALTVFVAVILLWRRYRGSKCNIKFIGRS